MPDEYGNPIRIQLKRTKGWRKPEGAIVVSRPSKFGNPYKAGQPPPLWPKGRPFTVQDAVDCYTLMVAVGYQHRKEPGTSIVRMAMEELAGHDLACWCPLTYPDGTPHPCHANLLLRYSSEAVDLVNPTTQGENK